MKKFWKHLRHGFRFPSCQRKINSGCQPVFLCDESTSFCKRGMAFVCNLSYQQSIVDSGLLSLDKTCCYEISAALKNDLKSFRSFTGQFFGQSKTDQQMIHRLPILSSHFAASGALGFMTLRYLSMTGDLRNLCEVKSWIYLGAWITSKTSWRMISKNTCIYRYTYITNYQYISI